MGPDPKALSTNYKQACGIPLIGRFGYAMSNIDWNDSTDETLYRLFDAFDNADGLPVAEREVAIRVKLLAELRIDRHGVDRRRELAVNQVVDDLT